jgi:hypothetical protein
LVRSSIFGRQSGWLLVGRFLVTRLGYRVNLLFGRGLLLLGCHQPVYFDHPEGNRISTISQSKGLERARVKLSQSSLQLGHAVSPLYVRATVPSWDLQRLLLLVCDERESEFQPRVFRHIYAVFIQKFPLSNSLSHPKANGATIFPGLNDVGQKSVNRRAVLHAVEKGGFIFCPRHPSIFLLFISNPLGVNEAFDTWLADFINEMTAGLVEHSKELDQKVKFRLRHAKARGNHGAIVLTDSLFSGDELIKAGLLGRR